MCYFLCGVLVCVWPVCDVICVSGVLVLCGVFGDCVFCGVVCVCGVLVCV